MQETGAKAALLELECISQAAGPQDKWRIWKESQAEMYFKVSSQQSRAQKLTSQNVDSVCAVSTFLCSLPDGTLPDEGLLQVVLEFLESAPHLALDPSVEPLLSSEPLGRRPLAAAAAAAGAALATPELPEEHRGRLVLALRTAICQLAQKVPESLHETDIKSGPAQLRTSSTAPLAVALLGDLAACCPALGSATWQAEGSLPALKALHEHTVMSPEDIAASTSSSALERRVTVDAAGIEAPAANGSVTAGDSGSSEARQLAREEAQAASLVLAGKLLEGYTLEDVPPEAVGLRKPARALLERAQTVLQVRLCWLSCD